MISLRCIQPVSSGEGVRSRLKINPLRPWNSDKPGAWLHDEMKSCRINRAGACPASRRHVPARRYVRARQGAGRDAGSAARPELKRVTRWPAGSRRQEHRLGPLTQPSGLFFCFCWPRPAFDGDFQANAFGRGRCDWRDKFSGPPLL
jgi:hypothetical protein